MSHRQGFDNFQKTFFLLALVFLYLSFLGGYFGIAMFLSFWGSLIVIFIFEKNNVGNSNEAALKIFGFFSKMGRPLLICFFVVFIVSLFFYYVFGAEVENISDFRYDSKSIFIILLTAPILEEFIFRWFLLDKTKKILELFNFKHSTATALLFSSIAFGISHTLGVVSSYRDFGIIIATFLVGTIIGKHFLKEGLISAMWLHGTYNLILFLALYNHFWVSL
ncbi:MAG: CPBP family glutamic-type intramembrane protease [Candidatus Diapherotrites archaeon]|nr:CPBP family glutamic-type intramembrane protease [Candidatus Diapherotrites archaeon]